MGRFTLLTSALQLPTLGLGAQTVMEEGRDEEGMKGSVGANAKIRKRKG